MNLSLHVYCSFIIFSDMYNSSDCFRGKDRFYLLSSCLYSEKGLFEQSIFFFKYEKLIIRLHTEDSVA